MLKLITIFQVNHNQVTLPYTHANPAFSIGQVANFVVVDSGFGVRLGFTGNAWAWIEAESVYKGITTGLCGNFNDNPNDDNLKEDGTPGTPCEVGVSWCVDKST